jgi:hypothetical protein
MIPHQWLIGGVAFAIGSMFLAAAITNHPWFFQLRKLRLLEGALGRPAARWVCAVLGCALIVLGGLIVSGRLPRNMPTPHGKSMLRNATFSFAGT